MLWRRRRASRSKSSRQRVSSRYKSDSLPVTRRVRRRSARARQDGGSGGRTYYRTSTASTGRADRCGEPSAFDAASERGGEETEAEIGASISAAGTKLLAEGEGHRRHRDAVGHHRAERSGEENGAHIIIAQGAEDGRPSRHVPYRQRRGQPPFALVPPVGRACEGAVSRPAGARRRARDRGGVARGASGVQIEPPICAAGSHKVIAAGPWSWRRRATDSTVTHTCETSRQERGAPTA